MTNKEYEKEDAKLNNELLKSITTGFDEMNLTLPKFEYDKEGKIKNKKEIDKRIKSWWIIILALWLAEIDKIENFGRKTIKNTFNYIDSLKTEIGKPKTNTAIIDKIVKDRMKKVKIKNVTKGNANRFNKRVQNLVKKSYKQGKTRKQTMELLQKEIGYNMNKAKSIAITERNYYRSESQLRAIEGIEDMIIKQWHHKDIGIPRPTHLEADEQIADSKGWFKVGDRKTKAPQHFGLPEEDISCHCFLTIELKK